MQNKNKILRYISFYVKSNDASVTPPIGPMLGQFPMDVKSFCTNFNNDTKDYDKGILLKVIITLFKDGKFEYKIKSSPLFFLLELASNLLNLKYNYKNHRGILLYDLFLITLIKNKEYNLLNIKYLFKKIIKEAKKNKYKVIENINKEFYYMYI